MRWAQRHLREEGQDGLGKRKESGAWLFYSYSRRKKEVPRLITGQAC